MICKCAQCGLSNLSVRTETETRPYGDPFEVTLSAEVNVYTCQDCGCEFSGSEIEDVWQGVINNYLREQGKMYKYTVDVAEVWMNTFVIESNDPLTDEECRNIANQKIEEGDDSANFEYSHTLDPENWNVNKT